MEIKFLQNRLQNLFAFQLVSIIWLLQQKMVKYAHTHTHTYTHAHTHTHAHIHTHTLGRVFSWTMGQIVEKNAQKQIGFKNDDFVLNIIKPTSEIKLKQISASFKHCLMLSSGGALYDYGCENSVGKKEKEKEKKERKKEGK